MTTIEAVIVCADCGEEIRREPTCFSCRCGLGFAATWDISLGFGRYQGRLIRPVDPIETKEGS